MFNNSASVYSSSTDRNFLLLSRVRLIVKFYIWPLLVLFGLIGNCLSILVLTRRRLIRTSTNNYLTILAVFDSCYLVFTLILNFGSHARFSKSSFTQILLFFLRPLADFSSNTATWLIVCFTLERTLAVARPIYAKRTCSVRRSRHLICALLLMCFLITLPTYFETKLTRDVNENDNNTISFNIIQGIDSKKQKEFLLTLHRLYLIFICIVIVWIPLTLLCICNSILIWYVQRSRCFDVNLQSKTSDETSSISSSPICKSGYSKTNYNKFLLSCSTNTQLKNSSVFHLRRHSRAYIQKRKVTIVLIFCLSVALLLWTPQSLSLTYETLIETYSQMSPERRTILLIFNNFANLFLCINASIDFILYCFLSDKFARTCRQIIWRQCSNHKTNSNLRSRMKALDRGSFIVSNTSNTSRQQQQQQQQLAATTTNNYYTQLYNLYRHSSMNGKDTAWKKKSVQTLTTPTNRKSDNRVYYRTSLIGNQQQFLTVKRKSNQQCEIRFDQSIDILSNTEDDYVNNELYVLMNNSISSNKQSHSDTISDL